MKIECFSVSKYKDELRQGDDIVFVSPDKAYALFDGATDPTGASFEGVSSGRYVARAAAQAVQRISLESNAASLSEHELLAAINAEVARQLNYASERLKAEFKGASTMALVRDLGDGYRFVLVGDTGMRLNGYEIIHCQKDVDIITTTGRIAFFKSLRSKGLQGDALEIASREITFFGLNDDKQIWFTKAETLQIIDEVTEQCESQLQADAMQALPELLIKGIVGAQHQYINRLDHSLGYAVINGGHTQGHDTLSFTRPKSEVQSIELYTDGYSYCPAGVSMAAWEQAYAQTELVDFHRIERYASVKGSSSTQFADDRSVLVIS